MKSKTIILAIILLVMAGSVTSWYLLTQQKSFAIEQSSSTNEPGTGTAPVSEPATTNEEHGVLVSTDKTRYVLGEKVSATIKNNTEKTVWIPPFCGTPFSLLKANLTVKKNVFDWETHGAYPTRDCRSAPLKIEPGHEMSYRLDLESIYAHKFFTIEPNRYKLEIQYTGVDAKIWPLAKFVFMKSFSNEFFIIAK